MVSLTPLVSLPELENDLHRVEEAMRRVVRAGDPFLAEVSSHLITAGGKRLRPALTLAVGRLAASPASDDVVMGAVAVELVHLGSLYHDDVMDEARTRRNVESVNARWGNLVAILAGDFLLATASEIAASLGTEVAALLARTIGRLCEGQVRELAQAFDVARSEEAYLSSIAGKTAALMATACRIGSLTAGLPRPEVEILTTYGDRIGMVFQIVDDVLDVVATDEELGKPAGNDLAEGVYTLPVIRALASDSADDLRRLLGGPIAGAELDRARQIIRSNGAVTSAIAEAQRYADQAAEALAPMVPGPVVDALGALGHHIVDGALPGYGAARDSDAPEAAPFGV